jgi:hypothetical protein
MGGLPSFVLLRHLNDLTPDEQAELLIRSPSGVEDELRAVPASGAGEPGRAAVPDVLPPRKTVVGVPLGPVMNLSEER